MAWPGVAAVEPHGIREVPVSGTSQDPVGGKSWALYSGPYVVALGVDILLFYGQGH